MVERRKLGSSVETPLQQDTTERGLYESNVIILSPYFIAPMSVRLDSEPVESTAAEPGQTGEVLEE